jgi:hypothetical protein
MCPNEHLPPTLNEAFFPTCVRAFLVPCVIYHLRIQ